MTDWPEAVREYEAFKKSGEEPGWDEEWPYTALEKADAAIEALEAELERLKVCGSCEHCNPKGPWCREASNLWNFEAAEAGWDWLLTDGSINDRVGLHFKCHFTPSRWTEATNEAH